MAITLERKGINYGHHLDRNKPFKSRVNYDLRVLWATGYRSIRPAMPPYDSPSSFALQKYITETALKMGFQVLYGVVSGGTTVTANRQAAHLANVQNTIVPYIKGLNNPKCILVIDNETEFHVDKTTLTVVQAIANITQAAQAIRNANPDLTITSVHPGGFIPQWQANGLGTLDYLGLNFYYGYNPNEANGFTTALTTAAAAFGKKLYVSEWGVGGEVNSQGFSFAAAKGYTGNAEEDFTNAMFWRLEELERRKVPHAVFSYGDGQYGVPIGEYSLVNADGSYRKAWYKLNGTRQPQSA